ncbi:helix-turn-helix domain-containing protein [Asanoa sp. NPDC049573]|uniref:helix-turn-helix domain-containing protein n=1 Tax=Asanoa sp. NPDC049573 TaxID=3155396 RepID=UPI00341E5E45
MTTEEVAKVLHTSERLVRRLVAERRIAYVKVGRAVRFEPNAVVAYVEQNRVVTLSRAQLRASILGRVA